MSVAELSFKTLGKDGVAYEVIEINEATKTVKIIILKTGEIVENYPLEDFENDPVAA